MPGILSIVVAACCAADLPRATAPPPPPPPSPITALAFAPDGRSIVVGSQQGVEIRSWPELQRLRQIETELPQVHDLAFSPDGTRLAIAGGVPAEEGAVEVYGWLEIRRVARSDGHSDVVYAVAWSDDSEHFAAASLDGTVTLRKAAGGQALGWLEGHSGGVKAVTFLPGGTTLVSGGLDQTLRVWNVSALLDAGPKHRALNPAQSKQSTRNDNQPMVRAPKDDPPEVSAPSDSAPMIRAPLPRARSTDQPDVRARSDAARTDSARIVRALTQHTAVVHDLALRPSAGVAGGPPALPWLASVSDDRTVRLWQPTVGRMVRFVRLADAVPLAVRWLPDGQRVIVVCTDGSLRAIDVETAAVLSTHPAIDGWAYSVAVHPDGKDAAVAGENGQIVRVRLP